MHAVRALGLLLAAALLPPATFAEVPKPAVSIARAGTSCVAPPAEIRRNHMEMLKHQRDRTLRQGERGAKVSLNACIDCHASTTTGSAAGRPGDFCESCHAYAAVKLDCFECHQGRSSGATARVSETRK